MKSIAVVTHEEQPKLTPSDARIAPLLKQAGITVVPVPWTEKVSWQDFAMVLIRSPWDYHLRYKEFLSWINMLENQNVNVWNTPETIRWNSNKSYITSKVTENITVVPTMLIADDRHLPGSSPWEQVVVKPTVGASSYETKRFAGSDTEGWREHLTHLLKKGGALFQEYIHEIGAGEYSFVFFDKQFSHAVIKKPRRNEFRVQPEFGGTVTPVKPDMPVIHAVGQILSRLPDNLLYARVDGLLADNAFTLMEIELCEPELFLDADIDAPQRFAEAILRRIP